MSLMTHDEMKAAAKEVNADTVAQEQQQWREENSRLHARIGRLEKAERELRQSLVDTIVELPDGRDVSLEMILAFPHEFYAHKRCTVCREESCGGEHDRRRG
jgi:hypothetical protein